LSSSFFIKLYLFCTFKYYIATKIQLQLSPITCKLTIFSFFRSVLSIKFVFKKFLTNDLHFNIKTLWYKQPMCSYRSPVTSQRTIFWFYKSFTLIKLFFLVFNKQYSLSTLKYYNATNTVISKTFYMRSVCFFFIELQQIFPIFYFTLPAAAGRLEPWLKDDYGNIIPLCLTALFGDRTRHLLSPNTLWFVMIIGL